MRKLIIGFVAAVAAAGSFTSFAADEWTGFPDYNVEYVQATGQQCIDTGVSAATPIEADMEMEWDVAPANACFLGARQGGTNARCYLAYGYKGFWATGYGQQWEENPSYQTKPDINTKYHVHTKFLNGSQVVEIDGSKAYNYAIADDLDLDINIFLFTASNFDSMRAASAKCYSLKIWQDGELKRDLRPCVKNGESCLFDKVTFEYFRNKTSTPLNAGPQTPMMTVDGIPDVRYDGTHACEPKVVVRDQSGEILGSDNYEVTYRDNTAVGTATVVVTGKAAYEGSDAFQTFCIYEEPDYFVEYLQATGQQCIDTGVSAATPIEADMEMEWDVAPANACFLGGRTTGGSRFYLLYGYKGFWTTGYDQHWEENPSYPIKPDINTRYHVHTKFSNGSQVVEIDGSKAYDYAIASDLNLGVNIFLFAPSNFDSMRAASAKCYSLKIWQDGELKRDLRPCVKNGEPCLYCLLSREFFRNQTATPLIAGPKQAFAIDAIPKVVYDGSDHPYEPTVVVRDPIGSLISPDSYDVAYENNTTIGTATAIVTGKGEYEGVVVNRDFVIDYDWTGNPDYFVRYIQADGRQCIDTLVPARTPIEADMEMEWCAQSQWACFLGGRVVDRCFLAYTESLKWAMGYGGKYEVSSVAHTVGKKSRVHTKLSNGSQVIEVDDEPIFDCHEVGDLNLGANIFLFCSSNFDNQRAAKAKCYSLKIWQDGELKRDFYPCVKNGEPCLYDNVSKTYFRNLTATPLEAGPRRSSPFSGLMLIIW